jgi:hypothetical protein
MTAYNSKHIESFLHMDDQFINPFTRSSTSIELGSNPLASTTLVSILFFFVPPKQST